jgi:xanthine dehydrogenase YagR molybdenum-binding subunit
MRFDRPSPPNPLDEGKVFGTPRARIDGPLKVTGTAPYAYEYKLEAEQAAYGFVLGSTIAKGRIASIDTSLAEKAPGVLLVLTHENAPKHKPENDRASPQLQGPEIAQYEHTVAFVVAETFEEARAAARLIRVTYQQENGAFVLADEKDKGKPTDTAPDTAVGDFEKAFAEAPVTVDVTYTTPDQSQSMMEPHASIAVWRDDRLTVYTSHQVLHWAHASIADTLGLDEDKVRVVSAYIGGGFGTKLEVYSDAILASMAAMKLGRAVKVALTRPQIYNHTTHRPATIQRIQLGADRDGRLTAVSHRTWSGDQEGGEPETASEQTKLLYGGDNRRVETRLTVLDLPKGGSMRAPGEAVGMLALECAMDELAEKLGMDPVELRIRNDIQYDPEKGPERPFSSRKLVECLRAGAETFGWSGRKALPGSVRDGNWLVGMGVASAFRKNLVQDSGARVRLTTEGRLVIETQQTDIGTGSYTMLGMIGAEMLGLPLEKVDVRLGDTDFPKASGSGGSWGANSSGSGVYSACEALRRELARRAGFNAGDVSFSDERIVSDGHGIALVDVLRGQPVEVSDSVEFGDLTETFAQASFGAHFAEVAVHSLTAEIRVRRMLSVCAAGRIFNPVTARSQCLGGMTMGIGAALMEECVVDPRYGYFVNHDLAEYHVPVHADIPDLEVQFLEELDDQSSPLRGKGVGELGICGVGAAVANAVYNACGVRVRDYPVTLDKIIGRFDL